jgi:hypothetical protein
MNIPNRFLASIDCLLKIPAQFLPSSIYWAKKNTVYEIFIDTNVPNDFLLTRNALLSPMLIDESLLQGASREPFFYPAADRRANNIALLLAYVAISITQN